MIIPIMKTVELADAPAWLAKYATDPNLEPVILTVKGKPVVVVLPTKGGDVESISVSLHPGFNQMMERSRRSFDKEGGIPIEEIRREFGLAPFVERKQKKRRAPAKNRKASGGADGRQV